MGLAAVLIVIVLVFLVSNTPRLILNLTEFGVHGSPDKDDDEEQCHCEVSPVWYSVTISISHFLLTVNSSINFLIYCSVGEKFQTIVLGHCKSLFRTRGPPSGEEVVGNCLRKKRSFETETTDAAAMGKMTNGDSEAGIEMKIVSAT